MNDDFEGLYAVFNLKHSMEVLTLLADENELRFSEIERKIGASSDVTTRVLDQLCEQGLLTRQESNPRTVHYTITDCGERFLVTARELEAELEE